MIAFGPVPSRRLGRSLGINNIPPKVCTYSCAYCQVGRTMKMAVDRRPFYALNEILNDVQEKVEKSRQQGEPIDYLTFVPDGEPTLDANLGREIEMLRASGIKIAVITNASLLWRRDVRDERMLADWVCLKLDSMWQEMWRRLNRPARKLNMPEILHGILRFADAYHGELTTETMLIEGMSDSEGHAEEVADMVAKLRPARAYLSIPCRPPAEPWVQAPPEDAIDRFYQIVNRTADHVECLMDYADSAFASTDEATKGVANITVVHPVRAEGVAEALELGSTDWPRVRKLVPRGQPIEREHAGRKLHTREVRGRHSPPIAFRESALRTSRLRAPKRTPPRSVK